MAPSSKSIIITEDGDNLTLILIPASGPVVFLMHGLPSSSDDFVISGPRKALAFVLANANYDVWIEHAQGTTVFFVMCSCRPEYNKKIRLFISLASTNWVWHAKSTAVRALIPLRQQLYELSQALGLYELLPSSPFALLLTSAMCSSSRFTLLVCNSVLFNILGFDYRQIDYDNSPEQLSHFPAGASFKQLVHYLQLAASKHFSQYDHGEVIDMQKYNASSPPDYALQNGGDILL